MDDARFRACLDELADDRGRGAGELARRCLEWAASSAQAAAAPDGGALRERLRGRCRAMTATRPGMAPIANLLDRWCRTLEAENDLDALRAAATGAARQLIAESRAATAGAAANARDILGAARTLLTHSYSSTIVTLFGLLRPAAPSVIVTESRPLYEGHRTIERLVELDLPATLITDAQIGAAMGGVDAVVVGADGVLPDGGVVSKAGTYPLALAARDRGVPFYVCAESFKRWPPGLEPARPILEEKDAAELGAPKWPGVAKRNLYFDLTPARLVTRHITEEGTPWRSKRPGRVDGAGRPCP